MFAGQRLRDFRSDQFDFPDEKSVTDDIDPTRNPGFDLADASMLARQTRRNLQESKRLAEEALKASQNAQEPQKQAPTEKSIPE